MRIFTHLKVKVLLASLFLGYALNASAAVVQLGPFGTTVLDSFYINKNGTGPGNGNDSASNLYRLNTYFIPGPDIILTDSLKPGNQSNDWTGGGLAAWDYAVVHFGAGAFGGAGGSIGAWQLNGENTFLFPEKSFSSIDLYRVRPPSTNTPGVPDAGSTVALLGLTLLGLGLVRKSRRL
jgi:hypothetical protein